MDDEIRVLRAMKRRDRSAWAVMYDRHVGDVFGLICHLLGGDRVGAEDLCQEVWLLALERIERFDPGRGRFRDWLLGIARLCVLKHYRKQVCHLPDGLPDGPSGALTPPELMELLECADVVRAAILCLDNDRRRVLLDKYVGGYSVAEIAARTGRTAKAVECLLSRARDQLRGLLRPYFDITTGEVSDEPKNFKPV